MMKFLTASAAETETVGAALAQQLRPGDVLAFCGDLGAGKTAFTRGLARGLGITAQVTSPTFTIVNEYLHGRLPLFHFDLYRLPNAEAVYDIGWDDYLERGGVCAVEWSENAPELMQDAITITIRRVGGEDCREITIAGGRSLESFGI